MVLMFLFVLMYIEINILHRFNSEGVEKLLMAVACPNDKFEYYASFFISAKKGNLFGKQGKSYGKDFEP